MTLDQFVRKNFKDFVENFDSNEEAGHG